MKDAVEGDRGMMRREEGTKPRQPERASVTNAANWSFIVAGTCLILDDFDGQLHLQN